MTNCAAAGGDRAPGTARGLGTAPRGPGVRHGDRAGPRRRERAPLVPGGLHGGGDRAGLDAAELRHTFVSLMSDSDVAVEEIARLVGHASSKATETVYRHQLRPVLTTGAGKWTPS